MTPVFRFAIREWYYRKFMSSIMVREMKFNVSARLGVFFAGFCGFSALVLVF